MKSIELKKEWDMHRRIKEGGFTIKGIESFIKESLDHSPIPEEEKTKVMALIKLQAEMASQIGDSND